MWKRDNQKRKIKQVTSLGKREESYQPPETYSGFSSSNSFKSFSSTFLSLSKNNHTPITSLTIVLVDINSLVLSVLNTRIILVQVNSKARLRGV